MSRNYSSVFRFKIELKDFEPTIWRRIQVPEDYSFWELHVAITDAMGWKDSHLHQFTINDPEANEEVVVRIPTEDGLDWNIEIRDGYEEKIADYFSEASPTCDYEYDFGDSWKHLATFEKSEPRQEGRVYPSLLGGEGTCPPEDVGGISGYEEFLEAIDNPEHEDHDRFLRWVGWDFDPNAFNPQQVKFRDPEKSYRQAYG
ncbi:plasmid pRiA4b ORF-3 family protein [Candidatus Bipolaricaulota bacterium]|nr:plasmid pRiA4b ORF-3 family protein [Candidatus Bipolaricaulota bacterium]